jgi:hypothetical protein
MLPVFLVIGALAICILLAFTGWGDDNDEDDGDRAYYD